MTPSRTNRRWKSGFGFIVGKSAQTQLRALLQRQNNENIFPELRENIRRLVEKHMDVKLTAIKQKNNLHAIGTELKEQYPDIFMTETSEKLLHFVFRVVDTMHIGRRHHFKYGPRVTRNYTAPISLSTQEVPKPVPQGSSRPSPSASQVTYNKRRNQQSQLDSKELTFQPKYDSNQYRAVYDFLQASMPPMTHLMDAFIDFGCFDPVCLHAISIWPLERIESVLNQLSPGSGDGKLTKMETFILQNHFREYFA